MQSLIIQPDHITFRQMLPNDLTWVVNVHRESFPRFFLTFLGRDFLALLYKHISRDPEGIVLVAVSDKKIEGFIAGVTRQIGFYQRLIKRQKWGFAMASLKALLRRPSIVPRLVRALRKPDDAQQASAEACLMSIAVRPEMEGKGIGRQLVEAFCQELAKRGAKAVCVTTDRDNNERINGFYKKLGFRISRSSITPEGRAMNEYIIYLK